MFFRDRLVLTCTEFRKPSGTLETEKVITLKKIKRSSGTQARVGEDLKAFI